MRHSDRHRARLAHIMEYHDGAGHLSAAVMDGCGRIFDTSLKALPAYKNAVGGKAQSFIFANRYGHRVARGFACSNVDDLQDLLDCPALRLLARPPGHALGYSI